MSLPRHDLSVDALMLLATGGSTPAILRELVAAQRSKQALLLWGMEHLARSVDHPETVLTTRAFDLLLALQRRYPAIAQDVVSSPAVSAWSLMTVRELRTNAPAALPGQLAAVTAAVAVRVGWSCELEVPTLDGRVVLPTVGCTAKPGPYHVARVTVERGRAVIDVGEERVKIPIDSSRDGPGWLGMRSIGLGTPETGMSVLMDDLHPTRLPGEDLADRVPEGDMPGWRRCLDGTWTLLARHHPVRAEEVRTLISTITPLTPVPVGLRSASSRETFGCVALSLTSDDRITALTLTHEVQHVKLCAVLDITRLTGPDRGRRYYAPWRDDPRPIDGLLQGSYAFLGVSGFWRLQRFLDDAQDAEVANFEFARWREAAELVATTLLDSGDLNQEGRVFVSVMLKTLESWAGDSVPASAVAAARRTSEEHRRDWQARNPSFG
jgi:uncharacterized protein